ncbi:hypothetical protein A3H09_02010 [Candidatus Falkowbacteria bacterium RIFCSPLOWO2_12_FULL_45_13]|uniref:Uncharacterized protein n=1 Tax=Candidatus Falkowbacteria bacterium RIFCSPLOWO2_12_FULL_45_13 TaxID=1797991 RepID=A0A1F5STZ0_9BACT|nr:MAG: hypothetical protein A3H09_02010 [Candidatus Falkowbacteria bacterium RIFCSPLOWO2_12_FULL_45_13]
MKWINFAKYTGVAALVAVLVMSFTGLSFWAILVLAEVGYLTVTFRQSHPRLAKWLVVGLLCYGAFVLGAYWFSGIFPLTKGVFSRATIQRDARAALLASDGLGPAQAVVVNNLTKAGDKLAEEINNLMATNGSPRDITNALGQFRVRWSTIRSSLEPAIPPPTLKPAKATSTVVKPMFPGVTLEINLTNGQVLTIHDDIRQGQSWRYLSFNGAFSHRIDKGDGDLANWKLADNNLPWTADYAGKLQVKAGNTAVKLTVNIP